MVEVINLFHNFSGYGEQLSIAFTLVFFTTVIVIYSIFVFYFYRFLAKKNLLELNLNQYNQYGNPAAAKFLAIIFFFLEYILLLPIVTFFWFSVLSIMFFMLAEGIDTGTILLITSGLVAAVRVTSYVSKKLSTDLAKMVPFTFLAIALTRSDFFNVGSILERATEIPNLFTNIIYFLAFIIAIEIIMRVAEFITNFFRGEDSDNEEDDD
jgi:hypothetical protein